MNDLVKLIFGLGLKFMSSIPNKFVTHSTLMEWSLGNLNIHIPTCSLRDLTTIVAFSYN
jgi:hypothetical protein